MPSTDQDLDEVTFDDALVLERPQHLRVAPRRVASPSVAPDRDDVVDRREVAVSRQGRRSTATPPQPAVLLQHPVDAHVFLVLGASAARWNAERGPRLFVVDGEWVEVELRVHPGERELDRSDAGARAALEERLAASWGSLAFASWTPRPAAGVARSCRRRGRRRAAREKSVSFAADLSSLAATRSVTSRIEAVEPADPLRCWTEPLFKHTHAFEDAVDARDRFGHRLD